MLKTSCGQYCRKIIKTEVKLSVMQQRDSTSWKSSTMKDKAFIVSAVAGVLLIGLIGGCERPSPSEEVRPIDWWEVNAAERAAKLEECKSNPKILDATPNCKNASRAENNVKATAKWGTDKEGVRTEPPIPVVP
jgi:hypothetical protein